MIASREDKKGLSEILQQPIYLSFQMKESVAPETRTGSTDDTETALSYEAKITDVTIVIAKKEDSEGWDGYYYSENGSLSEKQQKFTVVAIGEAYDDRGFSATDGIYTIKAKVDKVDVENFEDELYVFIITNSKDNLNVDYQAIGRDVQKSLKTDVYSLPELFEKGKVPEANKGFLMSSKEARKIELSWSDLIAKDPYSPEKAYNITGVENPIEIHRLPARIDLNWTHTMFKIDKSGASEVVIAINDKEGGLEYEEKGLSTNDQIKYTLKIDGIALVNMGQHYYLFQETSNQEENVNPDQNADNEMLIKWEIFGDDNTKENGKYVRDPYGQQKSDMEKSGNFSDYFFQSLNDIDISSPANHSDFYFRNLNEFALKKHIEEYNQNDAYNNAYTQNFNKDYAIFQYILPNSVHNAKKQLKNNSTGVIFRAEIGNNKQIEDAIDRLQHGIQDEDNPGSVIHLTENDIYAFNNEIFGDYTSFYKHVFPEDKEIDNSGTYETLLFNLVWENYILNINNKIDELKELKKSLESEDPDENSEVITALQSRIELLENQSQAEIIDKSEVDPELFRESCVRTGLRVYRATRIADNDWKYYCYYYYWISHNNNNRGNEMAPMEFSIVRNYVYKLSVSKIFDLGYPDFPGDDPDPLDPSEEVEQSDLRIEVLTRILPWGVREDSDVILK